MDFLGDYWTYCSCYEIHRTYAQWTAIGLIGAVKHRTIWSYLGEIVIHGNVYILMVGPQGNHKSAPLRFAKKIFKKVCPDYSVGASTQSAEDIVKIMSQADFVRTFKHGDKVEECRPYAFFINEFKDFIAYAPTRMLNFLGNIYDEPELFDASTIKRGAENIPNPSINLIGCENPEQLVKMMRNDIVTGGIGRRMIMVNEIEYPEARPEIIITDDAKAAIQRVVQRLIDARSVCGLFKMTSEGQRLYNSWYMQNNRRMIDTENSIMKGYLSSKNMQLHKVCMLLDVVSDKPMMLFTPDLLSFGLALLDSIELHMPKLSLAAGRNELMVGQAKMIDMLDGKGGMMPLKLLMKNIQSELNGVETATVLRHLEDTNQVLKKQFSVKNEEGQPVLRWMILTPERYQKGLKDGEWKEGK